MVGTELSTISYGSMDKVLNKFKNPQYRKNFLTYSSIEGLMAGSLVDMYKQGDFSQEIKLNENPIKRLLNKANRNTLSYTNDYSYRQAFESAFKNTALRQEVLPAVNKLGLDHIGSKHIVKCWWKELFTETLQNLKHNKEVEKIARNGLKAMMKR